MLNKVKKILNSNLDQTNNPIDCFFCQGLPTKTYMSLTNPANRPTNQPTNQQTKTQTYPPWQRKVKMKSMLTEHCTCEAVPRQGGSTLSWARPCAGPSSRKCRWGRCTTSRPPFQTLVCCLQHSHSTTPAYFYLHAYSLTIHGNGITWTSINVVALSQTQLVPKQVTICGG